MKQKISWGILISLICIFTILLGFWLRATSIQGEINTSIKNLYKDKSFTQTIRLGNTPTIEQTETCGYATIEWITTYLGMPISESQLMDENLGKITTSSTKGFQKELQKRLEEKYEVELLNHISDEEILRSIYKSLSKGMPVPISFEAINDWNRPYYTLHFSVVTGMSLEKDQIYISNVYGYEEIYSVEGFLNSLKFTNETLPPVIKIGQFFGLFNPNSIYIVTPLDEVAFNEKINPIIMNEDEATVKIIATYEEPMSIITQDNTVTLNGQGKGEYIIVEVIGSIENVQLMELKWDETKQDLIEIGQGKKIGNLTNQTLVIESYQPCSIPNERLKWNSKSKKEGSYDLQENGTGQEKAMKWDSNEGWIELF